MSKELKVAIEANDPVATEAALKKVKDINRKLPGADKPLRYACQQGADQVVEILVKAGARPPQRFDPVEDPFVLAAEHQHTGVLKRMIALGLASPEILDHVLADAAMEGRLGVFDCLLDTIKPPITAKLFRLAAEGRKSALIESLIRRGGDINAPENDKWSHPGYTPMHSAAEGGNSEELSLLGAHGANPNARTPSGMTPLMALLDSSVVRMQTASETLASIHTLLALGANASLTDAYGNDALCFYEANCGSSTEPVTTIRSVLLKAGAKGLGSTGQLFRALQANDPKGLKRAILAGADVNRVGPGRDTPLCWAANSLELTEILLKAGANPNRGADTFPLVKAARMGNIDVVKRLIASGADLELVEEAGEFRQNAFSAAEMSRSHAVVRYLKSLGAERPRPTQTELLKPSVGDWQDFSEIVVKADVTTVAQALAELLQGTVLKDAFGKSVVPGDQSCVVVRPKGMLWSNVFQITPEADQCRDQKRRLTFARQLARSAKAPVLLVDYSDTSDSASVVRVSPEGKTQRDQGWDYETLKELVDTLGNEAPAWVQNLLQATVSSDPTSTERLQQLAEVEKFVVAHFSIQGEWGSAMDIQFDNLAESVFEDVAFVTS